MVLDITGIISPNDSVSQNLEEPFCYLLLYHIKGVGRVLRIFERI